MVFGFNPTEPTVRVRFETRNGFREFYRVWRLTTRQTTQDRWSAVPWEWMRQEHPHLLRWFQTH